MDQQKLWTNLKSAEALKSKQRSSIRYKKLTVANNKEVIQVMLDESVIIEIIEQIIYEDGLEGITVRLRFPTK